MIKKYLFLTIALLTALVCRAQDGPTYTLTVSVNNEQGATPNGSGTYEAGQTVYVYVNLTTDYKLVKWTENGNDLETDVPRTSFQYVMPDHDVELKAYVSYNPETPEDPNVDERVFRTLTVITLPANTNVAVDTYQLEVGKTQTLSYPSPTDYRFLGWYLNGELVCETGNYLMTMPDHDLTLERRYVYDPTVPANPGANTWYLIEDGTVELIIDDFQPGGVSGAIDNALRLYKFDNDNVTSIIVKGKVYESDFSPFYLLKNLQNIDFTRTDLEHVRSQAWYNTGITTVKLPSSLKSIGNNAFQNCLNLKNIVCLALTPPEVNRNAFTGVHEGAFLYVPAASVELYQEADVWKDFIIYPLTDELTSLNVTLPLACADGRCKNMRLEVMNAKSGVRQKYIITDRMTYTFDLIHDCTYNIYIVSQKGEVLSQMENIELGTAPVNVTLPDLKTLYDVTLNVVLDNGTDVTDEVTAKWYDADGNYVTSGQQVTQLTEGYQLSVDVTLPEALARVCQMPERVEHTVAATNNKISVTLQPLEQKALCALVVNDEDGTYLNGAWLQATQTLNGHYNHNASGTTDTYGSCELTLFSGVPATLTVSLDGYYTESVNIDNIADMEALPTVRLKPFKGTTVTLLMEGYDDYKDLYVDVYNNTKEGNVSGFRLQYPYLVLPEGIGEDDVLAITAHSQQHRFADVTQTMTVKDGKLILSIVAKGSVEATYGESKNEAVRAMLYNAEGRLVEAKKCEIRQATFSYLPEGDYTVLMMGSSQLFEGISSLNDFNHLGLTEGKDFVKQTVSVKLGETAEVDFAAVPLFVEGKFSYVSNNASFICTTPHPRNGYAATFRADIDFKENYRDGISNLRLIVDYDDKTEFVKSSVILNTKLHDYAQGEQTVEIDDLTNGDEVKFCLMPIEDGLMITTAYVEFDYDGQHLRQPLGTVKMEVSSVVLVVPEVTPLPEVTLNLKNIPYGKYDKVEFYDNGVLIGTIPDLSSTASYIVDETDTRYSAKGNRATFRCKLHDPYYYSYHNIQARLTDTDGKLLLTEIKTVQYDPFAAVLSDMGIYCSDTSDGINLGTITRTNSKNRVYCGRPHWSNGDGYVNLSYYGHFLHSEYLPNLVKNVKLTKFISSDKTESWYMGLWCDLPNDKLGLHDDVAYDQRYLKYGETHINDRKVFLTGESCRLDHTPSNMAITFDYNEDFERPEDTESNNRFVKGIKAAMAEYDKQMLLLKAVYQKMDEELAKSKPDWDYFESLVEESGELVKKLTGGVEVTLSDEQKQLAQAWLDATSDTERDQIWNQLFTDPTQIPEYQEIEQWNNELMMSDFYIPAHDLGNGIWTPSYTYIVGTPNTGNILEDMSDGNWHLDESSNVDVYKYVFVNDKSGDRFIIDFSEHLNPNMATRRVNRNSSDPSGVEDYMSAYWDAVYSDASWGTLGLFMGNTWDYAFGQLAKSAAVNHDLASWLFGTELAQYKWIGSPAAPTDGLMETGKLFSKTGNALDKTKAMSRWGTGIGIAVSALALGRTNYKNFNEYYADQDNWDNLIHFVENNCGNTERGKELLQELKDLQELNKKNDWWNAAGNITSASCAIIISAITPETPMTGMIVSAVAAGIDGELARNHAEIQNNFKHARSMIEKELSHTDGCQHLPTVFTNPDFTVQWLADPSGYVYEAVPSNRIEGATATCYYKDSIQNKYGDWEVKEVLWDAENYEAQVNPQLTNSEGRYGWDVPQGMWQVRYEKDGYEPTRSEWLPVPPPQLEVNIPMVQRSAPEISMAHVYQDGIELLFSKYMQPETLTPEQLKVKVIRGGKETLLSDVKVELLNEEAEAKNSTTTFASYLKLTSETGWKDADEVMLIVDHRVKSYCGVPMQEDYMQRLDVEMRIEQIETEERVEMALGDSQELKVAVVPAEAGAGKTLRLTPSFAELMELSADEVVLNAEGKATVTVTGKAIGSTTIRLTIDDETTEEMVIVEVLDPENLFVKAPEASLASGSVLKAGEKVTLTTDTKDAQIYYTTDGSCPCDEQGSRRLYTEPIVITGETVLKAMAVKKGWYDSDIATFIFVVDGEAEGIVETPLQPATNTVQIYDLQGRRVNASQAHKGIFIVVGEGDMKPRKTVIK